MMHVKQAFLFVLLLVVFAVGVPEALAQEAKPERPNILFVIADDWSYPHAGAYGDPVVSTPAFDEVARRGVLFTRAFVSAPSCTPSRGAILTGQDVWRLGQGANLWSTLPARFAVYPTLLEQAGYFVGYSGKGRKPPNWNDPAGPRERNAAGPEFASFRSFLRERPEGQPFCYWFGSGHPHRTYEHGAPLAAGRPLEKVEVPGFLPDTPTVRNDLLNYYYEVEQFDKQVSEVLQVLRESGELEQTIVVVTSDNGMPFPRAKATLYDYGTHVPLAIMWPEQVQGGRVVEDFVSLTDLAPTFLEAAGVQVPEEMTGKSLLPLLTSGRQEHARRFVVTAMERHAWCRKGGVGYPMRAIRTEDYLYIVNFKPDRWPAGHPDPQYDTNEDGYGDIDASPTKEFMRKHREEYPRLFALGFAKRPAEELYVLAEDPYQMNNVADDPQYAEIKEKLRERLMRYLEKHGDPRVTPEPARFDEYPYYGDKSPYARAKEKAND